LPAEEDSDDDEEDNFKAKGVALELRSSNYDFTEDNELAES
jgi:hypothetical protein